jgi:hypothetical protein
MNNAWFILCVNCTVCPKAKKMKLCVLHVCASWENCELLHSAQICLLNNISLLLMLVYILVLILWVVTLCGIVGRYQHFGGAFFRAWICFSRRVVSAYKATQCYNQKNNIDVFITMGTSSLTTVCVCRWLLSVIVCYCSNWICVTTNVFTSFKEFFVILIMILLFCDKAWPVECWGWESVLWGRPVRWKQWAWTTCVKWILTTDSTPASWLLEQ